MTSRTARSAGFTLIEVLVALVVIALGVGALLSTLTASAESVGHLRDKSLAEWVALNRISDLRLAGTVPAPGVTSGEVEYGNARWRWRQQVADQGMAGILRVDVSVARADAGAAPDARQGGTGSADAFAALATGYGFIGTSVGPPSGIDPDWSLAAAAAPPGGGPGGNPPPGAPGGAGGASSGAGQP